MRFISKTWVITIIINILSLSCADSEFSGSLGAKKDSTTSGEGSGDGEGEWGNNVFSEGENLENNYGSGDPALRVDSGVMTERCAGTALNKQVTINFPKPSGCEKKSAKRGDAMSAYTVQAETFKIPENATLCGVNVNTSGNFFYDDEFFLLFDDYFLASANHTELTFRNMGMAEEGKLLKWDWNKHYGTKNDNNTGGCAVGVTCSFPRSQTNGTLSVNVGVEYTAELPKELLMGNQFTIKAVTAGNQNSGTDCTHSDLSFSVNVKYFE